MLYSPVDVGPWRSLVARLNGVQEVPGSSPGGPTRETRTSPVFQPIGPAWQTPDPAPVVTICGDRADSGLICASG